MKPSSESVKLLERQRGRLSVFRRILWIALPFLLVAAAADVSGWMRVEKPLEPIPPPLQEILKPISQIPPLEFPPQLFETPKPAQAEKKGGPSEAPPVDPTSQWKLLGVSLAATKRAFLENTETKQTLWVSEGDAVGPLIVREIRERAVILEQEGKTHEIRI